MKWWRRNSGVVRTFVLCAATAIALMSTADVYGASISSPKTRISAAGDKFDGVMQFAAGFEISGWSLLRAHHIEFTFGSISASSGNEAFASIGPVWRTPLSDNGLFVDVSIAPTLVSGSRYSGRDLGGHLHFTSSVSVGKRLGRTNFLALRIQHMSNGGLSDTNPGMDMVGLEFSFGFSE